MTPHTIQHSSNLDVSSLEKQTSPQSRSWKRRKKCHFDNKVSESSLMNIECCERSLQNEPPLSLKSSRSIQHDHRKHNYRLSYSDICDFTSRHTTKVDTLFQSIVVRLFISMSISSLLYHKRLDKQFSCKKASKTLKQKKKFLPTLNINLMNFCSLSSKVFSVVILISSLGTVCHALKNEFRK